LGQRRVDDLHNRRRRRHLFVRGTVIRRFAWAGATLLTKHRKASPALTKQPLLVARSFAK
jgi:hypothetical protein